MILAMYSQKHCFQLSTLTVLTGLVLTMTPGPYLSAQSGDRLIDCTQIDDPERRLACYDALIGRSSDETPGDETANAESQPALAPPQQNTQTDTADEEPTVDDFGQDSNPSSARIQREDEDFELIDSVADIRQYHRGRVEITLSSGQIWRQSAARNFHLNEGDEVRIYPSNFGIDYRLSVQGRSGFIQVRRIDRDE